MGITLPATVTPDQFRQIAPLLVRAILAEGNGWQGNTDRLTYDIANDQITGKFRDGAGVYAYRIWQEKGNWFREFRPIAGVEDIDSPAFAAPEPPDPAIALADRIQQAAAPTLTAWTDHLEQLLNDSSDLVEFQAKIEAAYPSLMGNDLVEVMAQGLVLAELAGRFEAASEVSP